MFRKTPIVLILIVVAGLVLAACGGTDVVNDAANSTTNNSTAVNSSADDSASSSDDGAANDAVVVDDAGPSVMDMDAVLAAGAVLDPALAADDDTAVLMASSYLYDTLVVSDGGTIGEGLAIEWDVSDDGLTYTFTLRADAVFSDGTPVNTDIVVANFMRWFDPEHDLHGDSAGYQAWVMYFDDFLVKDLPEGEAPPSKFDGIEKVDNLVFLLHLNEEMEDFYEIIAMPQFSILNPAALTASNYGTDAGSVVGSGAYVIDTWSGDSLVLVPSAGFWGASASDTIAFSIE